MTLLWQQI